MRTTAPAAVVAIIVVAHLADVAVAQAPEAPSVAVLVDRALQGESRYQREGARWRVRMGEARPGAAVIRIDAQAYGERFRQTLSLVDRDKETVLYAIIAEPNSWYVQYTPPKFNRFRPFEAPLPLGTSYALATSAMPTFATDAAMLSGATIRMDGADTCIARLPGDARAAKTLEVLKRELAKADLSAEDALRRRTAELKMQQLQDAANGIEIRIDARSGLIMSGPRCPGMVVDRFEWMGPDPASQVQLPDLVSSDQRGAWDPERSFDWIAFCHDPSYTPDSGIPLGIDGYLLNRRNGAVLRLPFDGAWSTAGSFSVDHDRVYVCGETALRGPNRVFEIDLNSLRQRSLGDELPLDAKPISPRCSPDGAKLAVTCMSADASRTNLAELLQCRVALIDVSTGALRWLANSEQFRVCDWFPDSQSLLGAKINTFGEASAEPTLFRLYLDGRREKLFASNDGVVLRHSARLLYQDAATDCWMISDFDGRNAVQLGDGLKELSQAAPAANEQLAVFIRRGKGLIPKPFMVNLITGRVSDMQGVTNGAWLFPVWR